MRQPHMVRRTGLSDVTTFVAKHPRVVLTVTFLVIALCLQGTVSAETTAFGEFSLVEPTAGHGASTGP